ncbi:UPF0481 protein [Spatholobus suberectus]|nr:UPF0481 protein [Spatholobus suberectus]
MAGNSNHTIEQRLSHLLRKADEKTQSEVPKIQRVAHHLRYREHITKHYRRSWCRWVPSITALQNYSLESSTSKCGRQSFRDVDDKTCWTLLVDGCALLHFLENAKLDKDKPHNMNVKADQLVLVMQDVLLLENQLPYLLLKQLWRYTDEGTLIVTMIQILGCHHRVDIRGQNNCSIILLDPGPNKGNHTQNNPNGNNNNMVTYRNIKELKIAGIELKSSKTRRLKDISFSYGWLCSKLTLPEIIMDYTTTTTLLNLIAYEMCPDFKNDYGISSYVSFLDLLIDCPNDVKALRSKRILLNSLRSDEEVANLFSILGADLVTNVEKYVIIKAQIKEHYKSICKTWLTIGHQFYFNNPWATIASHATVLGLTLTFIQTWYTIHPSK